LDYRNRLARQVVRYAKDPTEYGQHISIIEFIETMVTMADATTISVKPETKEMLKRLGRKGQTYDDLIRELVEIASIADLEKRWNRILEEEEFIPLDEL
jgi:predicted CopG family antitoxin